MKKNILEVKDLKQYFPIRNGLFGKSSGFIKAVDGVDLTIKTGETFGLVGESGCGKTTLGKAILGLSEITDGEVIFNGNKISNLPRKKMQAVRRELQFIFQDPYGSLDPRMRVERIIGEPLRIYHELRGADRSKRIAELMEIVGLSSRLINRYPHEFSGGQRQRIGIARALVLNPKMIICDEPVSALDVSIQSQVLNLLMDLQKEFDLTYLFIAHGLPVVKHISDRVGVMYLGKIVETTTSDKIFEKPLHPYTVALMSAVPNVDPEAEKKQIILEGEVPSPANPPIGCNFNTRCPFAFDRCMREKPELEEIEPDHFVSCFKNHTLY